MNWFSGIVVYVIVWWVVFFMALPWGVRVPDEVEEGHAPSAPVNPMLWRKALITSVITAVIWFAVFLVIESDLLPLRGVMSGSRP